MKTAIVATTAALIAGGTGMAITGFVATAGTDDRDRVERCVNGKPEVGDTYYPGIGNTGYDVTHYDLTLGYEPSSETEGDADDDTVDDPGQPGDRVRALRTSPTGV